MPAIPRKRELQASMIDLLAKLALEMNFVILPP
jgi:hypothetical protein